MTRKLVISIKEKLEEEVKEIFSEDLISKMIKLDDVLGGQFKYDIYVMRRGSRVYMVYVKGEEAISANCIYSLSVIF